MSYGFPEAALSKTHPNLESNRELTGDTRMPAGSPFAKSVVATDRFEPEHRLGPDSLGQEHPRADVLTTSLILSWRAPDWCVILVATLSEGEEDSSDRISESSTLGEKQIHSWRPLLS